MTANGTTLIRAMRVMLAVFLAANFVFAVLTGFSGQLSALINVAVMIGLALVMCYQTRVIRRMDRQRAAQLRPRPDYSAIAAMEREVYGEPFKHEGAPARTVNRPAARWDGRTTHPDTTQPASIEDYALWLQGYVKRGGKPTHFYDYPFSQVGFRYASSRLVVDSDYEYGSSLRNIIVAKNVTTERTNPAGPFDGWAHTSCYFMHGFRTNKSTVPVYSDPEFDAIRKQFATPEAARSVGGHYRETHYGANIRWERRS